MWLTRQRAKTSSKSQVFNNSTLARPTNLLEKSHSVTQAFSFVRVPIVYASMFSASQSSCRVKPFARRILESFECWWKRNKVAGESLILHNLPLTYRMSWLLREGRERRTKDQRHLKDFKVFKSLGILNREKTLLAVRDSPTQGRTKYWPLAERKLVRPLKPSTVDKKGFFNSRF